MHGLSMVTKGFITPFTDVPTGSGSGGAGLVHRQEEDFKPKIIVKDFVIENAINKASLTEDSMKVKSVKMIINDDKE
jgi:hypothetical protein